MPASALTSTICPLPDCAFAQASMRRASSRSRPIKGSPPVCCLLLPSGAPTETARKGSFFPSILEPRRRIDQALYAVVIEAYVNGVSTRSVDDLVAALGVESGISKSEVSRICAALDDVVGAFRTRRLDHIEFPYVYLDATYLHVRNQASQVSMQRCQSPR